MDDDHEMTIQVKSAYKTANHQPNQKKWTRLLSENDPYGLGDSWKEMSSNQKRYFIGVKEGWIHLPPARFICKLCRRYVYGTGYKGILCKECRLEESINVLLEHMTIEQVESASKYIESMKYGDSTDEIETWDTQPYLPDGDIYVAREDAGIPDHIRIIDYSDDDDDSDTKIMTFPPWTTLRKEYPTKEEWETKQHRSVKQSDKTMLLTSNTLRKVPTLQVVLAKEIKGMSLKDAWELAKKVDEKWCKEHGEDTVLKR